MTEVSFWNVSKASNGEVTPTTLLFRPVDTPSCWRTGDVNCEMSLDKASTRDFNHRAAGTATIINPDVASQRELLVVVFRPGFLPMRKREEQCPSSGRSPRKAVNKGRKSAARSS